MKNFFFVLVFVVFGFGGVQGQISLQYTFPDAYVVSMVRFGYAGDKYVNIDYVNNKIQIYGLSQVLEKEISLPSFIADTSYLVYYVSDNLFDLDSSIEYVAIKYQYPYAVYVLKEDSSVLLYQYNVAELRAFYQTTYVGFVNIYPSTDGTKLMLYSYTTSRTEVYSLPGNLPCYKCNNGFYPGNSSGMDDVDNQNRNSLGNPYPNPTDNLTRIDYQLPNGIKHGELVFYNTVGTEVKRFKVTNTFSFIYVSAHDLPSGTYYYNLQTSAGASDGKKMVVIR